MRILITGANGQVGRCLAAQLQGRGIIIPADRAALDLTKIGTIVDALARGAPDVIINTAAYTAVDRAEEQPELAMLVNATAPGIIAQWAAKRSIPLIHFSSDYVFDGSGERPWCEDDSARPLSTYGTSKLAGEVAIRAANGCFLILRTSWIYAAHGTNFLRTIVLKAREHEELTVVADQIGAPTSAAVIAGAIDDLLSEGIDRFRRYCAEARGVVHCTASGETSWHGFASAIISGLAARGQPLATRRIVPIRSGEYPARAKRPLNSRLDTTRYRKVTGGALPHWTAALGPELDAIVQELRPASVLGGSQ